LTVLAMAAASDPAILEWATAKHAKRVDWQMKIDNARTKLNSVYPKIKLWQSTGTAGPL